jgi:hypothetical protein
MPEIMTNKVLVRKPAEKIELVRRVGGYMTDPPFCSAISVTAPRFYDDSHLPITS